MAEPARDDRRYRAFLSYSHRDSEIAERFHRDLERWRADRDLVGRETGRGEVPRDLRPVFRDRDDFAGGRTLADATAAALEQSDNLIVLCSPNAASSPYVNDEIRRFKAMGRADRIVPVIVAGEPGDPDEDCFPQALLRMVDAAGEFTDERVEPLAADAREQGDGPRRALAKVIAGLLDLPFDEIVRRAERAQRRRTRLIAATAGVMGVLAVLAGGFGWLAEARRVEAERNFEAARSAADDLLVEVGVQLLTIEGIPLDTSSRLIGRATDIYDGLMDSLPDAPDMKIRKAGALAAFANAYANKGSAGDARSALEEAEALLEDVVAATEDERREAARLILADVKANLGDVLRAVGETEAARARFASAVEIVTGGNPDAHPEGERALMATQTMMKLGLLEHDSGRAEEAALWLGRAENLIEAETAAHPEDPKWPALAGILLYERSTRTYIRGFQLMQTRNVV